MRIFWFEWGKIARIPMIWLYMLGCLLYNLGEMTTGSAYFIDNNYLSYVNDVVRDIGWELGEEFEIALEELPDSSYKTRLQEETKGLDSYFQDMDVGLLGEIMIDFSGTREGENPFYAEKLEENFEKLEVHVKEIDSVSLLAGSQSQWIFDILFEKLFPDMMWQVSLFAVIVMMFLTDYEELSGTDLLVYSTKKGREIQKVKLLSGCFMGMMFYLLLCLGSFTGFFLYFDLGGILHSTMDSPFLSLSIHMHSFPFITWETVTFLEYFLWIFCLSAVFVMIFLAMAWVLALVFQDMFLAFVGFCVGLFCQYGVYFHCLYGYILLGRYFMEGSPLVLYMRTHQWLTYMGYSAMIPYQETWSIWGCFGLSSLLVVVVMMCFKRKDLLS